MGENSRIEWCDHTLNFWIGCQEVSAACDHCYARTQNDFRRWVNGWGPHGERKRTSPANWHNLRKWNRAAKAAGVRAKVFVNSLSDFFDNAAWAQWRREAWHYIEQSPDLDFLLLTKRPQNIVGMLPDPETGVKPWGTGWPNVWIGTTVEDNDAAAQRLVHLLHVPAARYFISYEPALGPLDLTAVQIGAGAEGKANVLLGWWGGVRKGSPTRVDWVICGGESGPKRRPMDIAWARSVRDQCAAAGVPFFMKQIDKVQPIPDDLMIRAVPQ